MEDSWANSYVILDIGFRSGIKSVLKLLRISEYTSRIVIPFVTFQNFRGTVVAGILKHWIPLLFKGSNNKVSHDSFTKNRVPMLLRQNFLLWCFPTVTHYDQYVLPFGIVPTNAPFLYFRFVKFQTGFLFFLRFHGYFRGSKSESLSYTSNQTVTKYYRSMRLFWVWNGHGKWRFM